MDKGEGPGGGRATRSERARGAGGFFPPRFFTVPVEAGAQFSE